MDLSKISSEELIEELNKRDLLEELGEHKKIWLLSNNFQQSKWNFIDLFSFKKNARCPIYSFEYIKNTSLEELIEKRKFGL
ncbi:hypothetical protein EQF93_02540 [Helcococcus ovis]|uniref:hypothetical protein n=1 Tax=Helcococcus ovis TaxID=72026 RepID=UPI0010703F18|nr:hypothetical protein [Helcococcus ovis]TFF68334.1 hypothetical protein EQF93_02540 [Helcococcus ovis]WNZ00914.1 hypothetical protein EQF90_006510 [Helcococcus ovis]